MAVRRSSGRGRPNKGASQAIKENVRKSVVKGGQKPKTNVKFTQNSNKRLGGNAGDSFDG